MMDCQEKLFVYSVGFKCKGREGSVPTVYDRHVKPVSSVSKYRLTNVLGVMKVMVGLVYILKNTRVIINWYFAQKWFTKILQSIHYIIVSFNGT